MKPIHTFLLVLGMSISEGVTVLPCGDNTITEVTFGKKTNFTCIADGPAQWRVEFHEKPGNLQNSELLAECQEDNCYISTTFDGLFVAEAMNGQRKVIVDVVNITTIWRSVQHVNGSLVCTETYGDLLSAGCGLNLVYLPEDVSCRANITSWSVIVSCVIGKVYSSRGIYKCQLFRLKDGVHTEYRQSKKESLGTDTMVTLPTKDYITKSEVKMSGSCQFNSTLSAEEGNYSFVVVVFPGGLTYSANFTKEQKWYSVERPSAPRLLCKLLPCLQGKTQVNCTCTAPHLGQPIGHLRLFVGNKTHTMVPAYSEQDNDNPREFHYTQTLSLSDDNIWVRCDVVWEREEILGALYTAGVPCM